jgi:hypothetical protein
MRSYLEGGSCVLFEGTTPAWKKNLRKVQTKFSQLGQQLGLGRSLVLQTQAFRENNEPSEETDGRLQTIGMGNLGQ